MNDSIYKMVLKINYKCSMILLFDEKNFVQELEAF